MIEEGIIRTNGWVVTGASKTGWTALLVGVVNQTFSGVNVLGIAATVPIMPDLMNSAHR
jgi:PhoPQ-activated pathogenicity-related protein